MGFGISRQAVVILLPIQKCRNSLANPAGFPYLNLMQWITIFLVAFVVIFLFAPQLQAVSAEKGSRLLRDGAKLIDVRTEGEFHQASVPGSVNFPLDELEARIGAAGIKKEETILVFCRSGNRSASAKRLLAKLGYTSVENLGAFGNAMKAAEMSRSQSEAGKTTPES